jgi:hypothetical protein
MSESVALLGGHSGTMSESMPQGGFLCRLRRLSHAVVFWGVAQVSPVRMYQGGRFCTSIEGVLPCPQVAMICSSHCESAVLEVEEVEDSRSTASQRWALLGLPLCAVSQRLRWRLQWQRRWLCPPHCGCDPIWSPKLGVHLVQSTGMMLLCRMTCMYRLVVGCSAPFLSPPVIQWMILEDPQDHNKVAAAARVWVAEAYTPEALLVGLRAMIHLGICRYIWYFTDHLSVLGL